MPPSGHSEFWDFEFMQAYFSSEREMYVATSAAFSAFFLVWFPIAWALSKLFFSKHFNKLTFYQKGDWCSRWLSEAHALTIVPLLIYYLWGQVQWDGDMYPTTSVVGLKLTLCCSVAYFLIDGIYTYFFYPMPSRLYFIVHHILASIPLWLHLFLPCEAGSCLAIFLLVEIANLVDNWVVWLRTCEATDNALYIILYYASFLCWCTCRLGFSTYAIWGSYHVFASQRTVDAGEQLCFLPTLVAGHLILIYCFYGFFGMSLPNMIERWQKDETRAKFFSDKKIASPISSRKGKRTFPSRKED